MSRGRDQRSRRVTRVCTYRRVPRYRGERPAARRSFSTATRRTADTLCAARPSRHRRWRGDCGAHAQIVFGRARVFASGTRRSREPPSDSRSERSRRSPDRVVVRPTLHAAVTFGRDARPRERTPPRIGRVAGRTRPCVDEQRARRSAWKSLQRLAACDSRPGSCDSFSGCPHMWLLPPPPWRNSPQSPQATADGAAGRAFEMRCRRALVMARMGAAGEMGACDSAAASPRVTISQLANFKFARGCRSRHAGRARPDAENGPAMGRVPAHESKRRPRHAVAADARFTSRDGARPSPDPPRALAKATTDIQLLADDGRVAPLRRVRAPGMRVSDHRIATGPTITAAPMESLYAQPADHLAQRGRGSRPLVECLPVHLTAGSRGHARSSGPAHQCTSTVAE
jgi:hypothetical protein